MAMTVRELIAELQRHDPDLEVVFQCDYGDRIHTQQALYLVGDVQEWTLSETAYSGSSFKVDKEHGTGDRKAVVINFSEQW